MKALFPEGVHATQTYMEWADTAQIENLLRAFSMFLQRPTEGRVIHGLDVTGSGSGSTLTVGAGKAITPAGSVIVLADDVTVDLTGYSGKLWLVLSPATEETTIEGYVHPDYTSAPTRQYDSYTLDLTDVEPSDAEEVVLASVNVLIDVDGSVSWILADLRDPLRVGHAASPWFIATSREIDLTTVFEKSHPSSVLGLGAFRRGNAIRLQVAFRKPSIVEQMRIVGANHGDFVRPVWWCRPKSTKGFTSNHESISPVGYEVAPSGLPLFTLEYTGGENDVYANIEDIAGVPTMTIRAYSLGDSATNLVHSYDLSASANDTIGELVAVLDAESDLTATLHPDREADAEDFPSTEMALASNYLKIDSPTPNNVVSRVVDDDDYTLYTLFAMVWTNPAMRDRDTLLKYKLPGGPLTNRPPCEYGVNAVEAWFQQKQVVAFEYDSGGHGPGIHLHRAAGRQVVFQFTVPGDAHVPVDGDGTTLRLHFSYRGMNSATWRKLFWASAHRVTSDLAVEELSVDEFTIAAADAAFHEGYLDLAGAEPGDLIVIRFFGPTDLSRGSENTYWGLFIERAWIGYYREDAMRVCVSDAEVIG